MIVVVGVAWMWLQEVLEHEVSDACTPFIREVLEHGRVVWGRSDCLYRDVVMHVLARLYVSKRQPRMRELRGGCL